MIDVVGTKNGFKMLKLNVQIHLFSIRFHIKLSQQECCRVLYCDPTSGHAA